MPGAVQNVGKLEGWNVERLGGREAGRDRWKKVASGPSAALGTSEWLVANGKQSAAETPRKQIWLLRRGRTTLKGPKVGVNVKRGRQRPETKPAV